MKRLFVLPAILAVLGLSSCEKEISKSIVGTWDAVTMDTVINGIDVSINMEEVGMEMSFTFREDGTGSAYTKINRETNRIQFVYELYGNILSLNSGGATDGVPITIEKKTMIMGLPGDILGNDEADVQIHFTKR